MNTAVAETRRIGQVICIIEEEKQEEQIRNPQLLAYSALPMIGVGQ